MFLYVFAHFCLARSGIFQGFSLGQDRANPETMPNKRMYPMKAGHDRERAPDPIFGRKTDAIHRLKLDWSKAAVMVTLNAPKDRARIATAVPKPTGQWTQMPNLCSGQPLAHQDPADPCTLSTTTCAEYLRSWNAVGTCDGDRRPNVFGASIRQLPIADWSLLSPAQPRPAIAGASSLLAADERRRSAATIPTLTRNVINSALKVEPDNAVGRAMSLRLLRGLEQGQRPFSPRIFCTDQYQDRRQAPQLLGQYPKHRPQHCSQRTSFCTVSFEREVGSEFRLRLDIR